MAHYIFYVTVVGGKYRIDHYDEQDVQLGHDLTYRFDQSDASNATHQIGFSSTDPSGSATAYTTGVTVTGTAGSAGAYTEIAVTSGTTTPLWYYDSVGAATGGQITTTAAEFVATANLGLRRPILGNSTETWGNYINQTFDVADASLSTKTYADQSAVDNSILYSIALG